MGEKRRKQAVARVCLETGRVSFRSNKFFPLGTHGNAPRSSNLSPDTCLPLFPLANPPSLDGKVNLSIVECRCCCVNRFLSSIGSSFGIFLRNTSPGFDFYARNSFQKDRLETRREEVHRGMDFNMDGEDDSRCKSRYNAKSVPRIFLNG